MAATVPQIKIGPVTLKGGEYGNHDWPQTLGIQPPRVVWLFAPDDAQALLSGPQEVTIEAKDATGATKKIQRVYVLGEEHSPDKLVRAVVLTDVRFYLSFPWVRAQYNILIESGTLRQIVADGLPTPFLRPVQSLIYAPYSLQTSDDGPIGDPWTADKISVDILTRACEGHDFPKIAIRNLATSRASFIPTNVYVDAPGDQAIAQTLGALGGQDIRVADDGAIEIVNAYLGAEKSTVDPIVAKYSLERKGVLRWISESNVAPHAGTVLITRRVEVRADAWEVSPGSTLSGDARLWNTDNNPIITNVIPVTDPQVTTPAGAAVQGTLLPVDIYCTAVNALGDTPGAVDGAGPATQLSRSYLLQGVGGNGSCGPLMSNALERNFRAQDVGIGFSDQKWAARCSAIRSSLRIRYKLNPVFARQCLPGSIKAERAGLLDAATATRQPATVYMDYLQRPAGPGWASSDKFGWLVNSIPGINSGGESGNLQSYPLGIKAYSNDSFPDAPFLLSAAQPAPWVVSVEDPTIGVFTFAPTVNRELRAEATTKPGLIWGLPVINPKEINRGNAIANWAQGKMLLTHRVAVVFSAIPGGPNNNNALHAYPVTVAEALGRLGAPVNSVTAKAPTKELRVREGTALARIPWDDAQRSSLLGCFNNTADQKPGILTPVNNQELKDYAVAVFANYLACVLDHYEGTMTIGYTPGLMPVGALQQVIHSFGADGRFYTTLIARGVVPVAAPENLISQSSRNVLFRGIS